MMSHCELFIFNKGLINTVQLVCGIYGIVEDGTWISTHQQIQDHRVPGQRALI